MQPYLKLTEEGQAGKAGLAEHNSQYFPCKDIVGDKPGQI